MAHQQTPENPRSAQQNQQNPNERDRQNQQQQGQRGDRPGAPNEGQRQQQQGNPDRKSGLGRDDDMVGKDTDGDGKTVQPGQKPGQSHGTGIKPDQKR